MTVVTFPEEDVGILSGTDRAYIAAEGAQLEMEDVEATFEQLPYIFEAGVKAVNTGAVDTGGTGYVYTYPLPRRPRTRSTPTRSRPATPRAPRSCPSATSREFKLSRRGRRGGQGHRRPGWARAWRRMRSPAPLSLVDVEEILFSNGVLWIDTTTVGTTTKSNTLMGMELDVPTGWRPIMAANGAIHFSRHQERRPRAHAAASPSSTTRRSIAEKAAWKAKTRRLDPPRLHRLGPRPRRARSPTRRSGSRAAGSGRSSTRSASRTATTS